MELVSFAKDVIQNVAEQAASYRLGQSALRHLDRALWVLEKSARWAVPPPREYNVPHHGTSVVAEQAASYRLGQSALRHLDRALWVLEKSARWAVPPPLDEDERPQPELVRPLPWVFFLMTLVTLRVTRESISLVNLILGKPPLRSVDVVIYIQSKRRYLRTLKYQGSRNIRARRAPSGEPWYSGLRALLDFTMCFRRSQYGNNNTTRVSHNDEVLVVKRSKRTRDAAAASAGDATMERLIEKMMVELDADSDDDSSYTLTNATSLRSLRSEESELDQDSTLENITSVETTNTTLDTVHVNNMSPLTDRSNMASSTPEKSEMKNGESDVDENKIETEKKESQSENVTHNESIPIGKTALSEQKNDEPSTPEKNASKTESPEKKQIKYSPKETTNIFLQSERCSPQKQSPKPKFGRKIAHAFSKIFQKHENTDALANGRAMSVPNKKRGLTNQQRRDSESPVRLSTADDSV